MGDVMSNKIKIVGEWRTSGCLPAGHYLWRVKGHQWEGQGTMLREPNEPLDRVEYFGPIEIVEPEPEPVPLAGCVTWIYKDHRNSDMVHCCCSQIDGVSIIDCRGHTRRERQRLKAERDRDTADERRDRKKDESKE
jgi:hypothetical protein